MYFLTSTGVLRDGFDPFKNYCITWKWIREFRLFKFEFQMCKGKKMEQKLNTQHHMCSFVCLLWFLNSILFMLFEQQHQQLALFYNCFISYIYVRTSEHMYPNHTSIVFVDFIMYNICFSLQLMLYLCVYRERRVHTCIALVDVVSLLLYFTFDTIVNAIYYLLLAIVMVVINFPFFFALPTQPPFF